MVTAVIHVVKIIQFLNISIKIKIIATPTFENK